MQGCEIMSIGVKEDTFILRTDKEKVLVGKTCICALPRPALQKIAMFRPLAPLLKQVECSPLCRIYSTFKQDWNKGLPVITTNNRLRMVIPINTYSDGTTAAMVSYTDNKFARYWKRLSLAENGMRNVDKEIVRLMKETTGRDIPKPLSTMMYYWDCGVGYWGIGADSEKVEADIIQPFKELSLFVCSEHFSAKHQQWIEGALDTSNRAIARFFEKN